MAAVTADRAYRTRGENNKVTETVAIATAGTVYVGALANYVSSTGRVTSATAAASRLFAGIVEEIVNDSGAVISSGAGNTAGTVKAKIAWGHQVYLDVLTAARTFSNLTKNVFVGDNASVTDTTGAGTAAVRVKVGMVAELAESKTKAWVALRVYGSGDAA
jgi:hypothetical protein